MGDLFAVGIKGLKGVDVGNMFIIRFERMDGWECVLMLLDCIFGNSG